MSHEGSATSAQKREQLLIRAQTGDTQAQNVLFESCRETLYSRALRILARPQDAEDAVQDAMLAAFRDLHRFQRRSDFLTWATRIVINAALQQIRKNRTRHTVDWDQVDHEFGGVSLIDCLKDPEPTPEERLQGLEHKEILQDVLRSLPIDIRNAIHTCEFADYPLNEAASALGLSLSTLKARLHRGRRALAVSVKKEMRVSPIPAVARRRMQLRPIKFPGRFRGHRESSLEIV